MKKDTKNAMALTESDNDYLYKYKGDTTIDQNKIKTDMRKGKINRRLCNKYRCRNKNCCRESLWKITTNKQ